MVSSWVLDADESIPVLAHKRARALAHFMYYRAREKMREFDPVSSIESMSPTALLLIPAEKESLIPSYMDAVKATYERAQPPKNMIVPPIRHFEMYREPWLSKSADVAINWFKQHL